MRCRVQPTHGTIMKWSRGHQHIPNLWHVGHLTPISPGQHDQWSGIMEVGIQLEGTRNPGGHQVREGWSRGKNSLEAWGGMHILYCTLQYCCRIVVSHLCQNVDHHCPKWGTNLLMQCEVQYIKLEEWRGKEWVIVFSSWPDWGKSKNVTTAEGINRTFHKSAGYQQLWESL